VRDDEKNHSNDCYAKVLFKKGKGRQSKAKVRLKKEKPAK
jgi:hypothetical protein